MRQQTDTIKGLLGCGICGETDESMLALHWHPHGLRPQDPGSRSFREK